MKNNNLFSRDRLIKNLREWHSALTQYRKNEFSIEALEKAADMLESDKQTAFNLACERAARDVLIEEIPRWISVKDRVPPNKTERYLVVCVFPDGQRVVKTSVWAWDENDERGDWINWEVVTHWMALPDLPEDNFIDDEEKKDADQKV